MSILRRATISRVTANGVWAEIPSLGPRTEFGPMERGPFVLSVGDRVLVGQASGELESFVVIAPLVTQYSELPQVPIYYFEDAGARDAIFPGVGMLSPTFTWIDDLQRLEVWTDETNSWQRASWHESRVAAIETVNTNQAAAISTLDTDLNTAEATIVTHTGQISALQTRATNLEGLAIADTATLDLTLSGASWPKTLSGVVLPAGLISADANNGIVAGSDSKLFSNNDVIVCTSGTRPGTPVTGQLIFETDTLLVWIWTGSAWDSPMTPHSTIAKVQVGDVTAPNTSLVDTMLSFYAFDNSYYVATYDIAYTGGSIGDLGWDFSGPAGFTYRLDPFTLHGGASGTTDPGYWGSTNTSTGFSGGAINGSTPTSGQLRVRFKTLGTPGTILFRIKQNTNDPGTVTKLLDMSGMTVTRAR